ncbi:MAG: hypothetical protein OEW75_09280 [Cyclobacteriaceae bacterium]|nr:hypothetical protein [Cyclobacteriaceae bacterium]
MLSELEKDLLIEIINIGVGKASANLSEILNARIQLEVPSIKLMDYQTLLKEYNNHSQPNTKVMLKFSGTMTGSTEMVLSEKNADSIVAHTMGIPATDPGFFEAKREIISEIGNIVLNSVIGNLSNSMEATVEYQVPQYLEKSNDFIENDKTMKSDTIVLFCETKMVIDDFSLKCTVNIFLIENSFARLGVYLRKEIQKYL